MSVATVLAILGLSFIMSRVLGLTQGATRGLMGGMFLLALFAGYLVFKLLSRSASKKKGGAGGEAATSSVRDLDTLWAQAKKRLAASKTEGSKIGRRPLVIMLGPERSTKSTLVEQSGLAAEHLAGELYRGETIAATERLNVWYGPDGTVFLEVGDPVLQEDSAWRRLLKHVRPKRLKAVFGRGRQAPRAVVVCYPCDKLADAAETEGRVRELRERLLELSGELGTRVPVYVVFTKFDKIPYFEAFARNLQPSEVTQILGATLPLADAFGGVDYEQRESRRVLSTFEGLVSSMASRRVDLLGREGDENIRQDLYEFAREFAKLRDRVATFLLDLCRPSRLAVSPFLRGYYFTGVRPIELTAEAQAAPAPSAPGAPGPTDASRIFDVGQQQAQMAAQAGGRRRVPEWVFVRDLFARVFSGDEVAREVTGGGAQVNLLRRAAVLAVVSAIAVFIAGMTVSFVRNRALATDVRTAVDGVQSLSTFSGGEASSGDLARMDALREVLDRMREYRQDGPPLSMRWGLFRGDRLFPQARAAYFAVFDRVIGDETKASLGEFLAGLPETPPEGADPAQSYDALRAYVQTTTTPDSAADGDLAGVLTRFWGGGSDSTHRALAEQQFAFFARELRLGDPVSLADPAEQVLIDRGQRYQAGFNDEEHLYRSLLAQAGAREVRFSPDVVSAGATVPGAFTAEGWQRVQDQLNSLDLSGKPYVVGAATLSSREAREMAERFRERYTDDFIAAWTAFLASADVRSFNLAGAAATLDRLRAGDSPLLELFALVNRNTAMDSGRVRAAFQPIHHLMPADTTGGTQLTGDQNQPYVSSLDNLWGSLSEYTRAQTDDERQSILEQATGQADQVLTAVTDVARGFEQSGDAARVGSEVTRILRRPADQINQLARVFIAGVGRSGPNSAGAQFCSDVSSVFDKYPFSLSSGTPATVEDLNLVFQPGSGLLQTLEDDLADVVRRAGPSFRPASADGPQPTDEFLAFMTRALAIQTQLYRAGDRPRMDFTLAVDVSGRMERVVVNIGGSQMTVTSNVRRAQVFTWDPASSQTASITVTIEGSDRPLAFEGGWAVQRLFGTASWESLGGGRYELTWTIPQAAEPVVGELQLPPGALILDPRVFSGLGRCPSPVVR